MAPAPTFSSVSLAAFNKLLDEYPAVVLPKMAELDIARYETIPASLAARKAAYEAAELKGSMGPALMRSELLTLAEWKLSHGTFRPTLLNSVASNSEDDVLLCTGTGFSYFKPDPIDHVQSSLKSLSALKGIGPATASLLMSTWDPESAPFFSDELFRWALFEAKPGKGWDRVIKYTPKEYMELYAKVAELRMRLGVKAVDVEKVAYVLGRRATGKSAENVKQVEKASKGLPKGKRKAESAIEDDESTTKKPVKKTTTAGKQTAKKLGKEKPAVATGSRSSVRLKSAS